MRLILSIFSGAEYRKSPVNKGKINNKSNALWRVTTLTGTYSRMQPLQWN